MCTHPHADTTHSTFMQSSFDHTTVSNLPITVIPAAQSDPKPPMVVYLSGDGGWNAFSQGFCQAIAQAGMPVVGIDALKYFRKKKSPGLVAEDISQLILLSARMEPDFGTAYRLFFRGQRDALCLQSIGI